MTSGNNINGRICHIRGVVCPKASAEGYCFSSVCDYNVSSQTYIYSTVETAKTIFQEIYDRASKNTLYDAWAGLNLDELAEQYGVQVNKNK